MCPHPSRSILTTLLIYGIFIYEHRELRGYVIRDIPRRHPNHIRRIYPNAE